MSVVRNWINEHPYWLDYPVKARIPRRRFESLHQYIMAIWNGLARGPYIKGNGEEWQRAPPQWPWAIPFRRGNCFLHHITAPDSSGIDETVLKQNFWNICSGFFYPERNFILRIFFIQSFSFLFLDFHFWNRIISFLDFFFPKCIIFNFEFFCPK